MKTDQNMETSKNISSVEKISRRLLCVSFSSLCCHRRGFKELDLRAVYGPILPAHKHGRLTNGVVLIKHLGDHDYNWFAKNLHWKNATTVWSEALFERQPSSATTTGKRIVDTVTKEGRALHIYTTVCNNACTHESMHPAHARKQCA